MAPAMIPRLLKLPKNRNILLFGARGTGKSTLLKSIFEESSTYWINLLDPQDEEKFSLRPHELIAIVKALPKNITHIVIDEIQKVPKLLDVVHLLIESTDKKFILTGSSARKLKRGGANLLAGRAFIYNLFPFNFMEIKELFNLEKQMRFGSLPQIINFNEEEDLKNYLVSYTHTYLKEEILEEQHLKNLNPFRRFLEVAAQSNGKIINYSKIARDTGVSDINVKEYFSILEDTLIGFLLEPFHSSFRKRLSQKPKFYFFDTGIARSLSRMLSVELVPQSSAFGEAFEHLVIVEAMRLMSYFCPEYKASYIRTKDDVEIDLVIKRPAKPLLCIEIKSNSNVVEEDVSKFAKITNDLDCEAICLSNDQIAKIYGTIKVMPWQQGLREFFCGSFSE